MEEVKTYPEKLVFGLDIGTRSIVGTVGYKVEDQFYIVAQRVCSAMGLWPRGRNWNRRRNGLQNRGGHRRNQREIGRGGRGISYC